MNYIPQAENCMKKGGRIETIDIAKGFRDIICSVVSCEKVLLRRICINFICRYFF